MILRSKGHIKFWLMFCKFFLMTWEQEGTKKPDLVGLQQNLEFPEQPQE